MNFDDELMNILEQRRTELNPGLWTKNGDLRSEIRGILREVAHDFIEQHMLPMDAVLDVVITGSIANYNWTESSDVDLHIIVDFSKIDDNRQLVHDYYRLAKSLWNGDHEIDVCGHEVEIYVQDFMEPHHSTGVYSVWDDRWIVEPIKDSFVYPDQSSVRRKANAMVDRIDKVEQMVDDENNDAYQEAERLKTRIKKMRRAGLESGGESSIENLAFKKLRSEGHLDRLSDLHKRAYDQKFSVEKCER